MWMDTMTHYPAIMKTGWWRSNKVIGRLYWMMGSLFWWKPSCLGRIIKKQGVTGTNGTEEVNGMAEQYDNIE